MINPIDIDKYNDNYITLMIELERLNDKEVNSLSYPFIPIINHDTEIAIIGLETKGWIDNLGNAFSTGISFHEIALSSMSGYQRVLNYETKLPKSKFGLLRQEIKSITGHDPQWFNFFAFDFNSDSIAKCKNKTMHDIIVEYSIKKLAFEIKLTNPKVLFFAGSYYGNFNKLANLLTSTRKRIVSGKYFSEEWDERIIFRIPHPASRVLSKGQIIKDSINLAKKYLNKNEGGI